MDHHLDEVLAYGVASVSSTDFFVDGGFVEEGLVFEQITSGLFLIGGGFGVVEDALEAFGIEGVCFLAGRVDAKGIHAAEDIVKCGRRFF